MNLVVDVFSIFYHYKKIYNTTILINGDKIYNKAISMFEKKLRSIITQHNISKVTLCMETAGILKKTVKFDPNYKKHRVSKKHKMDYSFLWLKKLFNNYDRFEIISQKGFEGDDLAFWKKLQNKKCLFWSFDSDLLQLIDLRDSLIFDNEIIDYDTFLRLHEFKPTQIITLKALLGDRSDGIKRVPSTLSKECVKLNYLSTGEIGLTTQSQKDLFKKNLQLVLIGSIIPDNVVVIEGKYNKEKLQRVKAKLKLDECLELDL